MHDAGVVDQDVDRPALGVEFSTERVDARERRQVEPLDLDVLPGLKCEDSRGGYAAVGVLPVSTPTAATGCGLTRVPQSFSLSARPAARIT